jgi:hypothetical protein
MRTQLTPVSEITQSSTRFRRPPSLDVLAPETGGLVGLRPDWLDPARHELVKPALQGLD